jgi:hypothetical protein
LCALALSSHSLLMKHVFLTILTMYLHFCADGGFMLYKGQLEAAVRIWEWEMYCVHRQWSLESQL